MRSSGISRADVQIHTLATSQRVQATLLHHRHHEHKHSAGQRGAHARTVQRAVQAALHCVRRHHTQLGAAVLVAVVITVDDR